MGGSVGLGGRRPDPGLLVPDASRQEAEANLVPRCVNARVGLFLPKGGEAQGGASGQSSVAASTSAAQAHGRN